jgi:hypothetical protein
MEDDQVYLINSVGLGFNKYFKVDIKDIFNDDQLKIFISYINVNLRHRKINIGRD